MPQYFLVRCLSMLFEEGIRLVTVVTCAFWPSPATSMHGFIRQSAGSQYSPHPYDQRCTRVLACIQADALKSTSSVELHMNCQSRLQPCFNVLHDLRMHAVTIEKQAPTALSNIAAGQRHNCSRYYFSLACACLPLVLHVLSASRVDK